MNKKLQIGVMGPSLSNYPKNKRLSNLIDNTAEKIGRLLAENNAIVLTGGCDGVMEAAMRGAKQEGGYTIGFPGPDKTTANKYCNKIITTKVDIGSFAFAGIPRCNAIITIPWQSAGTIAEIGIAYRYKIPNILLRGYNKVFDENYIGKYFDATRKVKLYGANTPEEAVKLALKLAK